MRHLLLILFLLWPGGAFAQTRAYFSMNVVGAVSPANASGWEDADQKAVRWLKQVKELETIVAGTIIDIVEDTANDTMDRQYVSTRMASGATFTSGTTTINSVVMMREYAGTDDVTQCITSLRVVSEDGTTVRATLLATANYGPTLEFINNATHRNKRCADGDTVTATYTTVTGDRLVYEIGYKTDGAETTPQASGKWGDNATDCAANETNTTDCAGWFEISTTITWLGEISTRKLTLVGGD